jgi:hypothetical protein
MGMSDRNILNRGICVASALALLVAVMTSPIRSLCPVNACSRLDCLRRNFAIPATHPARISLKTVVLRTAPVKAVRSETEEEKLSGTSCPAWCASDLPPSSSPKAPAWAPATFGLAQSSQPLRC